MRYLIAIATVALSLVTLPARADTAAYLAQQLVRYEKYAGAPIGRFPMISLWQWQVVGPEKLVLWPEINKAYLVTVQKPCTRLEWTRAIGITQNTSMYVDGKFDAVVFDHQNCRIQEIRPIDYKALQRDEKAAKQTKASGKPQDAGGT